MKKKDLALLLGFLGVVAGVCAYFFGYQKMVEKANDLSAQSAQLEADIAKYEGWEANRAQYETETEEMRKEIASYVSEFPSNNLPEDDMKLAYGMDSPYSGAYLFINAMSFSDPTAVYTTDYSGISAVEQETGAVISDNYPVYTLYEEQTGMTTDVNYPGIKAMIKRILDEDAKKSIESVVLSYDNGTGILNGTVVMNSFYLYGSDKAYAEPNLTAVLKGTEDPFLTLDAPVSSAEEVEAAAPETTEEASAE